MDVVTQLLAEGGLVATLVTIIVAFLKKKTEWVTGDNAAQVSAVVGVVLVCAGKAVGMFDIELSYLQLAMAGIFIGLGGSGGWAAMKTVGVKKDDAAEAAGRP